MSRRLNRCCECGGILGHHMTGCPETPDAPDNDNDDNLDDADASEMEDDDE